MLQGTIKAFPTKQKSMALVVIRKESSRDLRHFKIQRVSTGHHAEFAAYDLALWMHAALI